MNNIPLSQQYKKYAGDSFKQEAVRQAQIELADELRKQNKIQKESNELMKQQIEFLQSVNAKQELELKKQRKWSVVAWVITTGIAMVSIITEIVSLILQH